MFFQALNAAFLFEQFLLVGDLGGEFLVLFAQGDEGFFLGVYFFLNLPQLCRLLLLQFSQITPALGEGFKLLPAVEVCLFALPVLTQFGQGLAGQALDLLGLDFFQCGVGSRFCLVFQVDRGSLLFNLAGGLGEFLDELLLCLLLRGVVTAQFGLLFELLTPDAEAFAELSMLWVGGAEIIAFPGFALALLQGLLRLVGDLDAVVLGRNVLGKVFGPQFFAFGG